MLTNRTIQHALRTPLSVILGMISFLKEEPLTSKQRYYVDLISQSANHLLVFANCLKRSTDPKGIKTPDHKIQVLMVEDSVPIQMVQKKMLTDLNCTVDIASKGQEALSLADKPYDLILLDIGLPDMSGINLALALRQNKNHEKTPIIALTAYTDPDTQKNCIAVGIDRVIHKPVDSKTLALLLHAYKYNQEQKGGY